MEERCQLGDLFLVVDGRQTALDVLEGGEEILGRWRGKQNGRRHHNISLL